MGFDAIRHVQHSLRDMVSTALRRLDHGDDPDLAALARAQAHLDAASLLDTLATGTGATVLAGLDRGTRALTDINARVEYGARLTRAETTYIAIWITSVGALQLGRLHGVVRRAVETTMPERSGAARRAAIA